MLDSIWLELTKCAKLTKTIFLSRPAKLMVNILQEGEKRVDKTCWNF